MKVGASTFTPPPARGYGSLRPIPEWQRLFAPGPFTLDGERGHEPPKAAPGALRPVERVAGGRPFHPNR